MASTLDIRPLAASEAELVVPLIGRLLEEIMELTGIRHFQFDPQAALGTAIELLRERRIVILLARAGTQPIGFVALSPCHALYAGGSFGIITELFVEPDYRSHGIGAELLGAARRHGVDQGWSRLEVTTPPLPEFDRTLRFYERHGFAITGGRKLKLPL